MGKVVLITGASSGIGRETAKTLLREGYTVFGAARRVERMAEIEQLGGTPLRMDITREDDRVAAVARIQEDHGGVEVLINNAGYGSYGAMEDTTIEDARRQFEVNLFGAARLTQLVLPSMRRRGAGKIVNVSSMAGKIYAPLGSWYHATKHALEGWSDCLRLELAPFGIDVVIVEPGVIQTEFGEVMRKPMMDRSGGTAYANLAQRMERWTVRAYQGNRASPPSVIADVIARAIRARRPRPRYAAGRFAKTTMFLRKWLGDRLFDWILRSAS